MAPGFGKPKEERTFQVFAAKSLSSMPRTEREARERRYRCSAFYPLSNVSDECEVYVGFFWRGVSLRQGQEVGVMVLTPNDSIVRAVQRDLRAQRRPLKKGSGLTNLCLEADGLGASAGLSRFEPPEPESSSSGEDDKDDGDESGDEGDFDPESAAPVSAGVVDDLFDLLAGL